MHVPVVVCRKLSPPNDVPTPVPSRPQRRAGAAVQSWIAIYLACTALPAVQAHGAQVRATIRADADATVGLVVEKAQSGSRAILESQVAATPLAPGARIVWFVLPSGQQAEAVQITVRSQQVVGVGVDAAIPNTAPWARLRGGGAWRGYPIAFVELQPFFRAADGLSLAGEIDVELSTRPAPTADLPIQRLRPNPVRAAADLAELKRRVVNPADAFPLTPTSGIPSTTTSGEATTGRGPFRPAAYPDLEGSDVAYVIITPAALAPNFQVLADWKTRRGVPAVVQTLESIQSTTRHGSDLQETIRNYLKDAYTHWSLEWVLLGGDTECIPARYLSSTFNVADYEEIPSDLYFAGLDGNWNANGDAVWGQAPLLAGNPDPDGGDLLAEVAVSRAPVLTPADVDLFVQKVIAYETPADPTYQDTPLFLAEVLFPVNWDTTQAITMDGGQLSQDIIDTWFPGTVTTKRRFEDFSEFPGAMPISRALTLADLNNGFNLVNHMGHGFRYNMSVGDMSVVNADADALTNGDRLSILNVLNCTSLAFDYSCLAEHFLSSPNGGAAGVVGASRAAYPLPASLYQNDYYNLFYNLGVWRLGELFYASRLNQVPLASSEGAHRWTQYIYNMLGDPELTLFRRAPEALIVVHPVALSLGLNQVVVSVSDGSAQPVAGARVCLQKGDDDYAVGLTDSTGGVTLPFRAESPGSIDVTVVARDARTYMGSIDASVSTEPYVHVASLTLDDGDDPDLLGNRDGILDAGERVDLLPALRNDGSSTASSVLGVATVSDPFATMTISNINAAAIPPGSTTTVQVPVRLQVDSSAPDGHVVEILFSLTDGQHLWSDPVRRVVHAPSLAIVELAVHDDELGNGNGLADEGETFDVEVTLKNYGTGAVDGLTAMLQSQNPLIVQVDQGSGSYGRIATLSTASATFRLTTNFVDDTRVDLQLTDSFNRLVVLSFDLQPPDAPTSAPVLDPSTSPTIVLATWTPVAATDVVGYHVYRSTGIVGPWTRITLDATPVSYFRDTGLQTSTRYYYRVEAIDTSGNRSLASPSASVSTNPPQLEGWPIDLLAETASSPAVGDLDGDGVPEIVQGDLHVYAWTADGVEIVDADNDAQTWGVFNAQTGTTTAAVALGELDGTPGLEVVSCNWSTNDVFVLDADGTVLWSRVPQNGGSGGYWGTPALADVNGDGFDEVFAPSKDGRLYAWDHTGTPLLAGNPDGTFAFTAALSRSSPALGNLDADPQLEIVITDVAGNLYAWNVDGTSLPNFPRTWSNAFYNSPVLGDLDGDGTLEIVAVSLSGAQNLHVVRPDGSELPGFPLTVMLKSTSVAPSPTLADLDGDGLPEIVVVSNEVVATDSKLYVYRSNGTLYPGWPRNISASSESSPVVADFDGDGSPDIVHGSEAGVLHGWSQAGIELSGFPLSLGDFIRGTPAAGDFDLDGDIDLALAGWDRTIYVWDLPAPWNPALAHWPTFLHDTGRTARSPVEVPSPTAQATPLRFALHQNRPNPFNPVTRLAFEIPGSGPTELLLFDVRGRLIRSLVHRVLAAGRYEVVWDGRDEAGKEVGSGVYFSRLIGPDGERRSRRLVLLK